MMRARWLESEFPVSFSEVCDVFFANQYNDSVGAGFVLNRRTASHVKGKYIEKSVKSVTFIDPFGVEVESVETSYYTCQFELYADRNLILIHNPPRTLKSFIAKMHELFGLGVVLAELKVEVSAWFNEIKKELDKVEVKHISAYGISVKPHGLAKLSVSGKVDIQEEFNTMVKNHQHKIDVIKFDFIYDNSEFQLELNKAAGIRLKGNQSEEVLSLCSRYLS